MIVHDGAIVGRGHNRRVQKGGVALHGEIDAFAIAGRRTADVCRRSVLYTTLSPCPMGTGAILLRGIPNIIAGENRSFMGCKSLLPARGVEVDVLREPT